MHIKDFHLRSRIEPHERLIKHLREWCENWIVSSFLWFRGIKPITKSPSLSAQAERKHILFNRKHKIETGLAVFKGYRLRQKMHYGILTWIFGCCCQNLSVCHLKKNICDCVSTSLSCLLFSNSQLEKDLVFQRCTVSSADWAVSTCSPQWVQPVSRRRTLPTSVSVSELSRTQWLQQTCC